MIKSKICIKCGEEKQLSSDFFPVRKSSKDGYRNECKGCKSKYLKKYYKNNREKIIAQNSEYRKNNWDKFTENRLAYEERNKDRLREWRREYNEKNKDEIARKKKIHVENNREKYAEYYLQWARNNVDKAKAKRHRREARLKKLPYTLTIEEWNETLEVFNHCCAYCETDKNIEKEHFIPLSKNGGYTKDNIIPACASCNSSKQDTCFFEWYPKFKWYSARRERVILDYLGYNNNKFQQLSIL